MFCPKCGALLLPKMVKNKKLMSCSCGFTNSDASTAAIKEEVKRDADISVLDGDDDDSLPETDAECPKCKNDRAKYWLVQTRAADEPETKFLKCVKCKHIWRDYS